MAEFPGIFNLTNFTVNGENDTTTDLLAFKVTKITLYATILLLSIIGNFLVIFAIYVDKKMRASSHIFILHLAICDLLTPTLSIPFDLVYDELQWPFGGVMCKFLWPFQTFLATSSVLILAAICIDRYRALVFPFKPRWKGKRLFFRVLTIFIMAAIVVIPYTVALKLSVTGGRSDCVEKWPTPATTWRKTYTMILVLVQYGIPLLVMVVLYSIALYSLFHSNQKNRFSIETPGSFSFGDSVTNHKGHPIKELTLFERRREQHLRVTKMFIIVVIVFAISMFPNQVLWLWVDYGDFSDSEDFPVTATICRLFTYSNSVLNPVIYGLYSKEFRSAYIKAGKTLTSNSQGSYEPRVQRKRRKLRRFYKNETKGSHHRALMTNGTTSPPNGDDKTAYGTHPSKSGLPNCTMVYSTSYHLASKAGFENQFDGLNQVMSADVNTKLNPADMGFDKDCEEVVFDETLFMKKFIELQESRC